MKKSLLFLFVLMLSAAALFAQAPQKMSYQAVVRNANNTLVTNQNVSAKISILQGSINGTPVYVETHYATTNINGLLTIEVGNGTVVSGSMATVNWANGPFFLKSEIDPNGGINYSIEGTQQLMSVPYALYAEKAGNVPAFGITPVDSGYVIAVTQPGGTPQTYFLPTGGQGTAGPAGPAGPPGNDGNDGVGIDSISGPVSNDIEDTYTIHYSNGTTYSFVVTNGTDGLDGLNGTNGRGIDSIAKSASADQFDTYTIYYSDNTTSTFTVTNGLPGTPGFSPTISVASGTAGTVLTITDANGTNQYTIPNGGGSGSGSGGTIVQQQVNWNETDPTSVTYILNKPSLATVATSGSYNDLLDKPTIPTSLSQLTNDAGFVTTAAVPTFNITQTDTGYVLTMTPPGGPAETYILRNGVDGEDGAPGTPGTPGTPGLPGAPGEDGNGISNITGPVTSGNVDTYTIHFTNGTTSTFTVTNGTNGQNGVSPTIALDTAGSNLLVTITDANGSNTTIIPLSSGSGTFTQLPADWNATSGVQQILHKPTLATVATSGNYNDLTNKPTIPAEQVQANWNETNTSSKAYIQNKPTIPAAQVNADWNATSGTAQILNKPELATVATSGSYNDLSNKPTIPAAQVNADWNATSGVAQILNKPTIPAEQVQANWSETNTSSKAYIQNKPTIPAAQVNADWNASSGVAQILNKPTIPAAQVNADWNATSGVAQILNKPTIPAAQVNADWNATSGVAQILNKPTIPEYQVLSISNDTIFLTNGGFVKLNIEWDSINNKPEFAPVALTGAYNDLTGTPTIPNKTSDLANDRGFITLSDLPAQTQSDWDETDPSDAAFIVNKPTLADVATSGDYNDLSNTPDLSSYLTTADLSNFVTKTNDETIEGDKTFNGDVVVAATGSIEVPSVLSDITESGTLTLSGTTGTGDCEQAVNFCDLETVYQNMLAKFNALNDELDKLNDSINKLNKEQNTPKDGEACPTSPTVTDYSGNVYPTVRIGNQCWMRENMRCLASSVGNITGPTSAVSLNYSSSYARYAYPNTTSTTYAQYGRLYNYVAASQICPQGWRLPSSTDWNELRTYVKNQDKYKGTLDPTYYGKSLAFTEGWTNSTYNDEVGNNQSTNNKTGFSIKPAGHYPTTNGKITPETGSMGNVAAFWSSDKKAFGLSYYRGNPYIGYDNSSIGSTTSPDSVFMSVRCIRINSNGENPTIQLPKVETSSSDADHIYNVTASGGTVSLSIKPGVVVSNDSMPPMSNLSSVGFVYSSSATTTTTLKIGASGVTNRYTTVSTQPTSYPYVIGPFSVSGLTSGTKYYYRAYAIRGADTVYGEVKSFTAQSDPKSCKALLGSSYPEHISDYNGNNYATVAIGSQCWMAQNLRSTSYSDGTTINGYYIPNGSSSVNANYGRLYTFAAAMRGAASSSVAVQGVCPSGWHVPTPAEFETLKSTLQGNTAMQCNSTAANIAKAMASTSGWTSSTTTCAVGNTQSSNNASGFNAYPAGFRYSTSSFDDYGTRAGFLTTQSGQVYYLQNTSATVSNLTSSTSSYSMRCVYNGPSGSVAPTVSTTGTATCTNIATHDNNRSVRYTYSTTGTVSSTGGSSITARGICYGTTATPTTSNYTVTVTGSTGNMAANLSNLEPGKTYYYRAYATNAKGTTYGEVKSFSTPAIPTIYTYSSYSYGATTATLKGNITNAGSSSYVTLGSHDIDVYTAAYPSGTRVTSGTSSSTGTGIYSVSITGLTAGTQYYAVANVYITITIGSVSKSFYLYANNNTPFKPGITPEVSTTGVTYNGDNQTSMKFVWNGELTNAGTPTITEKGFVYSSTNSNPTLKSGQYFRKEPVSGTSTGAFSATTSWGSPNQKWYVRAYAISAMDTVYGSVLSFTTHDYPDVYLSNNYANAYYYTAEVTKNSITMNHSYSTVSASSTSGGCTGIYAQGLVYSTSPISITDANSTSAGINTSDAPSNFGTSVTNTAGGNYTITNLNPNTKYYIRAWARSSAGYTYSTEQRVVRTKMNCGSTLYDQDGNTYNTVAIGSQCWMKSNLKATHFDNYYNQTENGAGTLIATPTTGTTASSSTRYIYYPGGSTGNLSSYGYLYNWQAASGTNVYYLTPSDNHLITVNSSSKPQGACPRGWHLPTQGDMNTLNSNIDAYYSAFSIQYAGLLNGNGYYHMPNTNHAYYWSSTPYSSNAYYWAYYNNDHSHMVSQGVQLCGMSVRCIQD
ncbi:MAG: fibrobacter succinogenes major paralogous domain-containing protein [Bacteroidales bacterium]|nr:fibrobacter succinogenes major paralogous domain-containing protein [Bacteroidales bacterium]